VLVFLLTYLLPGVSVNDFIDAVVVALVLSLLNIFVKPILVFLTIPATIITLGLFLLVINALLIWWTHLLVDGFQVDNFWYALLFSVLLSVTNSLVMGSNNQQAR
jgi:putative membrane protein